MLPLESALQPYVPPAQNEQNNDFNFDLMEIINDVNDEDLLIAATQMEKQYETKQTSAKTALIKKKNQPEMQPAPFANCKIGSIGTININIYKQ